MFVSGWSGNIVCDLDNGGLVGDVVGALEGVRSIGNVVGNLDGSRVMGMTWDARWVVGFGTQWVT